MTDEVVRPAQLDVTAACSQPATLVLKMSYHPHWRVTVDGREQPTFMVSPGYIGVNLTTGPHHVRAEYDAGWLKYELMAAGVAVVGVVCGVAAAAGAGGGAGVRRA